MKKLFFLTLSVLACAACAKEVFNETTESISRISATIVNDQKTEIQSDGKVLWKSGDAISVNGCRYVTADTDVETATFTASSSEAKAVGGIYNAYYPEAVYNGGDLALPDTQNGGLRGSSAPMYARSSTTDFSFRNLCGVIKLNVVKENTKLSKIIVEANEPICGPFTIEEDAAVLASGGTKKVTVFFGASASISSATDFYVYLPAGTYSGLKFTFVSSNGDQCVKTAKENVVISRNSIKPIVFATPLAFATPTKGVAPITPCNGRTECEWVQLWENGPRFACYNVGTNGTATYETTADYKGLGEQYYCWGGITNKDKTDYSTQGTALSGESDTATRLWGKNWRMISQKDIDGNTGINKYCVLKKFDKGAEGSLNPKIAYIEVRGTGEYSDNFIILPYAGGWKASDGTMASGNLRVWMSNINSDHSKGQYISFTSDGSKLSFTGQTKNAYGYSVRAVYEPSEEDYNPTRGTASTTSCNGRTECDWIQLWENGPKFACYNVGSNGTKYQDATSLSDLGEQYYAWGGSTNKDLTDYSDQTTKLSGESDTATKLWGSNWRMMSQDDLKALKENCTFTKYSKGAAGSPYPELAVIVARGKNEYEDNMLVFPQVGCWKDSAVSSSGSNAYFWLVNTASSGTKACRVQWDKGAFTYNGVDKNSIGASVRAILVESASGISTSFSGGINFSQNAVSGNNGWL